MKEEEEKENKQFERLYELIKYATEMNWRLIEGGKVKPFTPESANQKRGFEDSTLILREETDKETKKKELMENMVVDILKKAEGELDEASKERLWEIIKKEKKD